MPDQIAAGRRQRRKQVEPNRSKKKKIQKTKFSTNPKATTWSGIRARLVSLHACERMWQSSGPLPPKPIRSHRTYLCHRPGCGFQSLTRLHQTANPARPNATRTHTPINPIATTRHTPETRYQQVLRIPYLRGIVRNRITLRVLRTARGIHKAFCAHDKKTAPPQNSRTGDPAMCAHGIVATHGRHRREKAQCTAAISTPAPVISMALRSRSAAW